MRALLLFLGLVSLAFGQEDWSTYHRDAARSGRTRAALDPARLAVRWTHAGGEPRPAWPGPARWDAYAKLAGLKSMRNYDPVYHPVIVGDALYYCSSRDDALICVDTASGAERWRYTTDGPLRIAPSITGGRAYFGSDDGFAYCVDAADGTLLWRTSPTAGERRILNNGRVISAWPVRTGVLVDDGVAYFGASMLPWRSSILCAVDAADGTSKYMRDLGTGWTLEGALLLSDENVVVPQGRVAPLVFARADGAPRGSLSGGGGSFCLLTDDDQVLHGPGNKDGWITGSRATSREALASYAKGNAIVVDGRTSYLLSDTALIAMDRGGGGLIWERTSGTPFCLIQAGDVLFSGGDGRIDARATDDGRLLWRGAVEGRVWGLAVARGKLFAATDRGTLVAFEETEVAVQPPAEEAPIDVALATPPRIADAARGLVDRWVFQDDQIVERAISAGDPRRVRKLANLGGGVELPWGAGAHVVQAGGMHAYELSARGGDIEVAADFHTVEAPARTLSVEAWVRVDQPVEWGGILSIAQDNGEYERGWMLGFRQNRFGFAVAGADGGNGLTWLLAEGSFAPRTWHHVVGTYDGKTMRIYVDGEEAGESRAESGDVLYPAAARYQMGAYRDDDEYFRYAGALAEVCLYDRALSASDVKRRTRTRANLLPGPAPAPPPAAPEPELATLAGGPFLEFVRPGEARIAWRLADPTPCTLEVTAPDGTVRTIPTGETAEQETILGDLRDRTVYSCRIRVGHGADAPLTAPFECDTHFDFASPAGPSAERFSAADLERLEAFLPVLLRAPNYPRGQVVLLGGGDGSLAIDIAILSQFDVLVLTREDPHALRETWRTKAPEFAHRMRALRVGDGDVRTLPRLFANLVLNDPNAPVEARIMLADGAADLVRPRGVLACTLRVIDDEPQEFDRSGPAVKPWSSQWTRKVLPGEGSWSHMYGAPDNSAFGGEALGGARSTEDLELTWIGRPGPRYQSDRGNRKPSPLAAGGKLFLQGLNRVIGLDAHNGSVLWSRELPTLQRFNIPRSSSNWCTDGARVYLAMGSRLHVLGGRNGITQRELDVPAPDGNAWEWGWVAVSEGLIYGTAVRAGSQFTDWWGSENWYDSKEGEHAKKVASAALFAFGPKGQDVPIWTYQRGVILEPTITLTQGRIVFCESRNPALIATGGGRVSGDGVWNDLWMVCLDAQTGEELWARAAKPVPGTVAFYLAGSDGHLVLVSSNAGSFAVYAFDLADGRSTWRKKFAWEVDHHGKHLSRPAIVGGRVYLRPMVFDLASGEELANAFPEGHQCGTYTCSANALFLRAGELAVWDTESRTASRWSRVRPDCWISTIPANGMLLSPEGGGGCSCGSWIETSMGFLPRER